jgi:hypothetical protein
MRQPVALAPLIALVLAGTLGAQARLTVGGSATGRLTAADQRFGDGSLYKLYNFDGAQGDTVSAELVSDDFDAMLVLTDAAGNRLALNDDGAESCNARLKIVLPAAGTYRLYANSASPHGLGEYRLRLARGSLAAPADTICRHFLGLSGIIQVGDSLRDSLTVDDYEFSDSSYFRRYALSLKKSQTVTVDLESDEFDAFLLIERGRERLLQNDDGGGGCHPEGPRGPLAHGAEEHLPHPRARGARATGGCPVSTPAPR